MIVPPAIDKSVFFFHKCNKTTTPQDPIVMIASSAEDVVMDLMQ